ncbi:[F-Actin]-Monooxygenase Mical2 [Manis pentadactyla]|nr:[F-Actin]-Monooxygenase Mical2 [Manis pentadactyla]
MWLHEPLPIYTPPTRPALTQHCSGPGFFRVKASPRMLQSRLNTTAPQDKANCPPRTTKGPVKTLHTQASPCLKRTHILPDEHRVILGKLKNSPHFIVGRREKNVDDTPHQERITYAVRQLRAPAISQWEVANVGTPSPKDLASPSRLRRFPPSGCSFSPSHLFPGEKHSNAPSLCLNKIYILLLSLFSFFHVSSLILHIKAPGQGPADEMPPPLKLTGTRGSLRRKLEREGGGRRAGS